MRLPIEELLEEYQNRLYVAALSICKNTYDAEDVVQDTFIKYLSKNIDYESKEHIKAWLLRVAINLAKNKTTTFFRRKVIPMEDYMQNIEIPSKESYNLFNAVMSLPQKYRIVIHLFYYEDYSVKEIAEILKISQENVKTRLTRGRKQLKTMLKEEWQDDKL